MEIANNRKQKNYQNGKIYCIRSYQTDLIYIGSTTQPLSKRLSKHRQDFNNWKNNIHYYITSIELIKYDDHYIEVIENYPWNSKEELEKREGELIRETENTVNKNIAGRTIRQYREDNKAQILEKQKQYREDNKEYISEYKKQYREENKEQIREYHKQHYEENKEQIREYHKQHYQINKTAILEQQKQYKEQNKDAIKLKNKEYRDTHKTIRNATYMCECGSKYTHNHQSRHFATTKHINYMNLQNIS